MKRLVRKDGEIGGVCKGLGNYFNIDETIFRILFLVGIFTPYPTIFTYVLLWIFIPKSKEN